MKTWTCGKSLNRLAFACFHISSFIGQLLERKPDVLLKCNHSLRLCARALWPVRMHTSHLSWPTKGALQKFTPQPQIEMGVLPERVKFSLFRHHRAIEKNKKAQTNKRKNRHTSWQRPNSPHSASAGFSLRRKDLTSGPGGAMSLLSAWSSLLGVRPSSQRLLATRLALIAGAGRIVFTKANCALSLKTSIWVFLLCVSVNFGMAWPRSFFWMSSLQEQRPRYDERVPVDALAREKAAVCARWDQSQALPVCQRQKNECCKLQVHEEIDHEKQPTDRLVEVACSTQQVSAQDLAAQLLGAAGASAAKTPVD